MPVSHNGPQNRVGEEPEPNRTTSEETPPGPPNLPMDQLVNGSLEDRRRQEEEEEEETRGSDQQLQEEQSSTQQQQQEQQQQRPRPQQQQQQQQQRPRPQQQQQQQQRDQEEELSQLQMALDGQDQHQAPSVLVVQQPIILGRGAYIRRGQPFMYRGVQLGHGRKIGMNCMITLGVFGGMLMLWGIVHGINTLHGFICVFVGAVQLGCCLRLCHKAKQDFDALPQEHPDRVTYSSPIVLSREAREIASSTTTYQLPPGAQIISSSPLQGGHMTPTYQLPAGAQVISSTSSVDGRLAPPAFLQQALAASAGTSASANDDKPPPYEEVCKQMRQ